MDYSTLSWAELEKEEDHIYRELRGAKKLADIAEITRLTRESFLCHAYIDLFEASSTKRSAEATIAKYADLPPLTPANVARLQEFMAANRLRISDGHGFHFSYKGYPFLVVPIADERVNTITTLIPDWDERLAILNGEEVKES